MGERDRSVPQAATSALEATLPFGDPRAPSTNPPPPAEADPLVGTLLKHFEVQRLLGRGGMGSVYLGRDTSLDRPVAIKVLAADIAHDPEIVARFTREARAQARLRHPNVAQMYFIGEDRGIHFFAMEYVEGPALDEILDRGERLPWPDALEHAIACARGLRAALAEGFVHRDVKPSNLLTEKASRLKIIDFGLVKSMKGDSEMTRDGAIIGSPLYMAPEQGRAETVDHRADIYSLGCTLYHLLTGRPPFVAPSPVAVISMHVTDRATPVRALAPDVPPALDKIVAQMMAKDPAERFADYDELIELLEAARPGRREYTAFRTRALALAVDLALVAVVARLIGPFAALFAAAYFVLCHRLAGQTLGKLIFRLKLTDPHGGRPSWKATAIRFAVFAWAPLAWALLGTVIYFVHRGQPIAFQIDRLSLRQLAVPLAYFAVAALVFLLYLSGFLMAAFHPKKRALHDIVSHTEVVLKAPRAAPPSSLTRTAVSISRSLSAKR